MPAIRVVLVLVNVQTMAEGLVYIAISSICLLHCFLYKERRKGDYVSRGLADVKRELLHTKLICLSFHSRQWVKVPLLRLHR